MPVKGMMFDSTPSLGTYASGYMGMSFQIPRHPMSRLPGLVTMHVLVSLNWLVERCTGNANVLTRSNMDLNDEALVAKDAGRVYLYAREDELVKWEDVEGHAKEARERGWDVGVELFVGTGHCRYG